MSWLNPIDDFNYIKDAITTGPSHPMQMGNGTWTTDPTNSDPNAVVYKQPDGSFSKTAPYNASADPNNLASYDSSKYGAAPTQTMTPIAPNYNPADPTSTLTNSTTGLGNNAQFASNTQHSAIGSLPATFNSQTANAQQLSSIGDWQQNTNKGLYDQIMGQQNPYSGAAAQGYINQAQQQVNNTYAGMPQQINAGMAAHGMMGSGQQAAGLNANDLARGNAFDAATNAAQTNIYNNSANWTQQHNSQLDQIANGNMGQSAYGQAAGVYGNQAATNVGLASNMGAQSNQGYGLSAGNAVNQDQINNRFWSGVGGTGAGLVGAATTMANNPNILNGLEQAGSWALNQWNNATQGGGGGGYTGSGAGPYAGGYGTGTSMPSNSGGYSVQSLSPQQPYIHQQLSSQFPQANQGRSSVSMG